MLSRRGSATFVALPPSSTERMAGQYSRMSWPVTSISPRGPSDIHSFSAWRALRPRALRSTLMQCGRRGSPSPGHPWGCAALVRPGGLPVQESMPLPPQLRRPRPPCQLRHAAPGRRGFPRQVAPSRRGGLAGQGRRGPPPAPAEVLPARPCHRRPSPAPSPAEGRRRSERRPGRRLRCRRDGRGA